MFRIRRVDSLPIEEGKFYGRGGLWERDLFGREGSSRQREKLDHTVIVTEAY